MHTYLQLSKFKTKLIFQQSMALIDIAYPLQNGLKLAFLFMSLFNMQYTIVLALVISLLAVFRVLKTIQFNQQYLRRFLMNNHGMNVFYLIAGSVGSVNYLFYAPLSLFYAFGLVEYINQKFPRTSLSIYYMPYVDQIRNNKFYIMEAKGRIQIIYWFFTLFTLPIGFNFMNILKLFVLFQYFMTKYTTSQEFYYSVSTVDLFLYEKTKNVGFVHNIYLKIKGMIKNIITSAQARAQQRQQ